MHQRDYADKQKIGKRTFQMLIHRSIRWGFILAVVTYRSTKVARHGAVLNGTKSYPCFLITNPHLFLWYSETAFHFCYLWIWELMKLEAELERRTTVIFCCYCELSPLQLVRSSPWLVKNKDGRKGAGRWWNSINIAVFFPPKIWYLNLLK